MMHKSADDWQPVLSAATSGDIDAVEEWLDGGGNPDASSAGVSILMAASFGGHHQTAALLLQRGATPDLRFEQTGQGTALMAACVGMHPFVVKLLIDSGATIGLRNASGRGALDELCDASRRQVLAPQQFGRLMQCTRIIMNHMSAQQRAKKRERRTSSESVLASSEDGEDSAAVVVSAHASEASKDSEEARFEVWNQAVIQRRREVHKVLKENERRKADEKDRAHRDARTGTLFAEVAGLTVHDTAAALVKDLAMGTRSRQIAP